VYLCFGGQPIKVIPYGVARRISTERNRQFDLDANQTPNLHLDSHSSKTSELLNLIDLLFMDCFFSRTWSCELPISFIITFSLLLSSRSSTAHVTPFNDIQLSGDDENQVCSKSRPRIQSMLVGPLHHRHFLSPSNHSALLASLRLFNFSCVPRLLVKVVQPEY